MHLPFRKTIEVVEQTVLEGRGQHLRPPGLPQAAKDLGVRLQLVALLLLLLAAGVGVVFSDSQFVYCVVGRFRLFLHGFFFRFKGFLSWAWMAVEGAVGLDIAGRGATLVLRTSWFNCSSWIRAKQITAIRVYGCRAFTSQISGFRPSIKVPKSYFSD
ncbi:hypothetical protein GW17_00011493 [Ensete ventricosum]|nr:hypothetical protein GW17_00011493 [Ensete ventricosum]